MWLLSTNASGMPLDSGMPNPLTPQESANVYPDTPIHRPWDRPRHWLVTLESGETRTVVANILSVAQGGALEFRTDRRTVVGVFNANCYRMVEIVEHPELANARDGDVIEIPGEFLGR